MHLRVAFFHFAQELLIPRFIVPLESRAVFVHGLRGKFCVVEAVVSDPQIVFQDVDAFAQCGQRLAVFRRAEFQLLCNFFRQRDGFCAGRVDRRQPFAQQGHRFPGLQRFHVLLPLYRDEAHSTSASQEVDSRLSRSS